MSAKYKSPSFLLPNELNTSANPANDTGINSLYSMKFDGSSGEGVIVNNFTELNGVNEFSISAWVKAASGPQADNYAVILQNDQTYVQFGISQNSTANQLNFLIRNSGNSGYGILAGPTNFFNGSWRHIVCTYDGSTMKFYVDNGAPLTNSYSTTLPTYSNPTLRIGRGNSIYPNLFNGQIDEVAIFNRALNTTEIAALYDGTGSNIRPSNLIATNLNPVAYYPLGEQAQNSGYPSASGNEWQFPNGVLQDYVMDFDGVNDFIDLNANNSFGFGTGDFTISMWLYREASSYSFPYILDFRESTSAYNQNRLAIYYQESNGKLRCYINGSDVLNGSTGAALPLNQWFNLILTRSSGTLSYYVNGSVDQSVSNSTNLLSTNQANLGRRYDNDRYFNGKISNLAIWNSSAANIANIYNNGSPQTSYTVAPQNWWKLNADSVYTPSAPNYTTALDFNGSSDYVNANTTVQSNLDFSVSAWINPASYDKAILGTRPTVSAGTSNGFTININSSGNLWGRIFTESTVTQVQTGSTIPLNNWSHIAIIYDSSSNTLKTYLNGSEVGSVVGSVSSIASINDLNIGRASVGSSGYSYFNGSISNIVVYNSALTASQISTLFNFGTPETSISFDPVAWWKLDDQNAITDSSGNGNTGTNNGATNAPGGVAYVPSWKITSALPIPTVNYTTALEFNQPSANGEYVDIGTISYLNQSTDFSISQWVFSSSTRPYTQFNGIPIRLGGGFIYLATGGGFQRWEYEFMGGSRQKVITGVDVPNDEWVHIAMTFEGTVAKFYQNGDLKHTGTIGTTYSGSNSRIGRGANSNLYAWSGKISNTALFNSVLSLSNIATLYNNGQPEATPSFSPLHWWKLDNTSTGLNDVGSAASNNGTLVQTSAPGAEEVATNVYTGNIPVNGVSTTLPSTALQQSDLQFDSPYSNYSLSFDGTGDKITSVSNSGLTSSDARTFSAWIKTTDTGNNRTVVQTGPDSTNNNFELSTFGGFLHFSSWSTYNFTGNVTIADGDWHFICITFDGSVINGYVDGNSAGPNLTNASASLATTNTPYYIGGSATGNSAKYFNGKIDEASIFNYSLSEAQVLEIYNNGKPGNLDNFSGTAPISWWRLGENAYFDNNTFTVPNSIAGAPNGIGSGTVTSMLSADAPGTYANGIGDGLAITDRVGDAALSVANSQSYNMIPDDKVPYVPRYVGAQTTNAFEMTFDGVDDYFDLGSSIDVTGNTSFSYWFKANNTTQFGTVLDINSSSTTNRIWTGLYSGKIWAYTGTGNSVKTTTNYLANTWYHITVIKTSSASISHIYINGVAETLISDTGSFGVLTTGGRIGNQISYSSYYTGSIDEVAIFDKALTADQIKFDLYKPTSEGTNQTADIANNPNLPTPVAWYRMGD